SVVTDDALGSYDVMDLLHLLRKREVSSAELRAAAQARIEAAHASLNAVVRTLETEGDASGPFAGIPTVLKDNEDVEGYPTLHGSWAPADRPATGSNPWVAQSLGLGFTPLAKTTLPEFGLTATTESSRYGATRNPWNTGHSTGGSSGGSAALVASGAVPIGHANDGGGSIRIPAALNGLVGLKPSRGRVIDLPELDRLPVNLVTQGVLTRSVRDTAYYFAEAERVYRNPDLPPIGMVVRPERRRLRVGLLTESLAGSPLDPHTRDAVIDAGRTLADLGHEVREVTLDVGEQFGRDFLRYWALLSFMLQRAGGRFIGEGFDGSKTEALTKGLSAMFVQQAVKTPLSMRRLVRASREPEPVYQEVDVVVSPVVSHPAPPIGYLGPDVPVREQLVRLLRFTSFTPLQNVCGSPAISLPLARNPEGLPIGVQVAAPVGEERRLLSIALELEEAMPWPRTATA
ncbi:MAG: amidase, partial [Actinomycetota bacterium]